MNPLEYLKFCTDDIYLRLIEGAFYSPEKAKEIIQTLESFVNRLSEVRQSEEKTNLILNEIDKFPDNEMRSIKHWLVKSLADDDSFVYAYNPLAQNSNRQTIIPIYQVKYIYKKELYELLNTEKEVEEDLSSKKRKATSPKSDQIDHSVLLSALSKYITGINPSEFSNIIELHSLTPDTPKAKWNGIPADAARFADHLNMGFANFSKLFELKDIPKLLPNHRQKVRESGECTTSEINAILEKFIPK